MYDRTSIFLFTAVSAAVYYFVYYSSSSIMGSCCCCTIHKPIFWGTRYRRSVVLGEPDTDSQFKISGVQFTRMKRDQRLQAVGDVGDWYFFFQTAEGFTAAYSTRTGVLCVLHLHAFEIRLKILKISRFHIFHFFHHGRQIFCHYITPLHDVSATTKTAASVAFLVLHALCMRTTAVFHEHISVAVRKAQQQNSPTLPP